MAVSASPPPSLSPLSVCKDVSICCPNLPFIISPSKFTNRRRQSIITLARRQKDEMAIDKKRELLEQYGLNPDEFLTDQPPKPRRKERPQKMGSGKEIPLGEFKGPRETHKLLQVLGGKARRMKLLSPKGMDVRPMMEVVKGAAFGILQVAGGCPASLRPGKWLDLFSGTGSVGIEAISRGCAEVHFVEMDPWVISDVLRPNLEWTGFLENSIIHAVRVENFLERAEQFVGKNGPFEYISVTPPYTQVDYKILMNQLSTSCLVGSETFILVEYALGTEMLDTCGVLVKIADRRFGRTNLAIYGPTWAEKKRKSDSKLKTTVRVLKNM